MAMHNFMHLYTLICCCLLWILYYTVNTHTCPIKPFTACEWLTSSIHFLVASYCNHSCRSVTDHEYKLSVSQQLYRFGNHTCLPCRTASYETHRIRTIHGKVYFTVNSHWNLFFSILIHKMSMRRMVRQVFALSLWSCGIVRRMRMAC